ncbi:MAG: LacI family transcriptional regulator [Chloroflexi bacterium]|nr:MAG: LacI family transcriptional regulator [Chloroflexota bacterium]
MAVTIHNVAQEAGVGIGTVSRVVNNSPDVKPATRERVLAAIHRLNYKPDPIARSMISKRTNSIGTIVPFFTRPSFMERLRGVEAVIARLGRELVLYNVETSAQRDHFFRELPLHRKVDGLLIISLSPDDAVARRFRELGTPVVLIDAYSPLLTSLVVNNVEGAYQAVKRLIELGHRHIGFINGEIEGNFKFNTANDRLIGLHRALGEAGLLFEPEQVLISEWSRKGGKHAALQLLTQQKRPTAIFAASDVQAVGALEAARELGLRVPEQLSVIGFDGIEISELLELSTMQQPLQEMGELGASKLVELIENPSHPPELIRFDTKFVERRTTSPALTER